MDKMTKAKAGGVEGSFDVTRTLSGAKVWRKGDKRDGKVAELAHLVETGALVAADKATAEAASAFLGLDVKVGEAPAPATNEAPVTIGEASTDASRQAAPPPPPPPPAAKTGTAAKSAPRTAKAKAEAKPKNKAEADNASTKSN